MIGADEVRELSMWATGGALPDVTVLLTVDSTAMGLRRATRRLGADRLELAGTEFELVAGVVEALARAVYVPEAQK